MATRRMNYHALCGPTVLPLINDRGDPIPAHIWRGSSYPVEIEELTWRTANTFFEEANGTALREEVYLLKKKEYWSLSPVPLSRKSQLLDKNTMFDIENFSWGTS